MNTASKMLLAAIIASACAPAGAVGRLVDLSVYDRTSQRTLPVYRHDGRWYVAGEPGHRYRIELRNADSTPVLGVLSVDGVNVLSGDTADWSQTGYVLEPFASSDVLGWRKSLSDVADFVFANASRSYAARTGRPDNVGVIGIAVFRPRRMIRPLPMPAPSPMAAPPVAAMESSSRASAAKAMDGGPIGTGHGERETSPVSYTDFVRASATPDEVITLYYDTRERLVAQGVIPGDVSDGGRPDPFPGHFVPDPR